MHPADRGALVALRALSGLDIVLKVYSGLMRERGRWLLYLASAVRVGGRQFHHVDTLYTDGAESCRRSVGSVGAFDVR